MTEKEVFAAALKLDHKKRADLAGRLLRSLEEEEEQLTPEQCEALWLEEAERRLQEWEEGKVQGIPAEEVFGRARARLRS